MSHHTRTVILLLIVIILVIIGWVWYGMSGSSTTTVPESNPVANNQSIPAQTSANTPAVSNAADISDAALQSDLNSVDTQLSGLGSDSAAVNQSVGQ